MKKPIQYYFLILLVILVLNNLTYSQKTIKFELQKTDIESFTCSISPDSFSYSVSVKLNPVEIKEFAKLTKENIGNYLKVVKNNKTIVEAVIKGEITNGRLSIDDLTNKNSVIKIIKLLLK